MSAPPDLDVLPQILSYEEFIRESEPYLRPPRERRLGRISIGEISRREVKPPDFVIDDWMIAREQSFMAGEPQSGKSFLALHAAMSIATGRDVLGRKTKQGLVIYQSGESGEGVMAGRVPAWIQHYGDGADFDSTPFELLPARVNLYRQEGNAEEFHQVVGAIAREWADRFPLRAVFIDTMSKVMAGANENDGRDVGRVLEHAERLSRETGAHVCLIHHMPKNGTGMRGHGSLKGDTDTVVMISVNEQKVRTVTFDKVKDGENGGKLQFELMQIRLGVRDDGKPITSCVVLPVGEKEAAKKAAEAKGFSLRPTEEPVFRALMEALKKHGRFADAAMESAGVPSGKTAVDFSAWRDEYKRVAPPDEDGEAPSNGAIAKRWTRYTGGLVKYGVIGWARPWMWWGGKPVRGFLETYPDKDRTGNGQRSDGGAEPTGDRSAADLDEAYF
jgi:hypothetical protein